MCYSRQSFAFRLFYIICCQQGQFQDSWGHCTMPIITFSIFSTNFVIIIVFTVIIDQYTCLYNNFVQISKLQLPFRYIIRFLGVTMYNPKSHGDMKSIMLDWPCIVMHSNHDSVMTLMLVSDHNIIIADHHLSCQS